MKYLLSVLGLIVALTGMPATASEPVKLSLFSWPGYGFWFIATEKGLTEGL